MAKQKQDDQLEHTYSSYVRIRNVALKTCQRRWMIGRSGERGSGISVLAAWHDDDDIKAKSIMNKCRLCGDKTINHIIEWCKLTQRKYKTKHDCPGKAIHWELYKKLKFDLTTKRHMHKSLYENETHKILWDLEIQRFYNLREKTWPCDN